MFLSCLVMENVLFYSFYYRLQYICCISKFVGILNFSWNYTKVMKKLQKKCCKVVAALSSHIWKNTFLLIENMALFQSEVLEEEEGVMKISGCISVTLSYLSYSNNKSFRLARNPGFHISSNAAYLQLAQLSSDSHAFMLWLYHCSLSC